MLMIVTLNAFNHHHHDGHDDYHDDNRYEDYIKRDVFKDSDAL